MDARLRVKVLHSEGHLPIPGSAFLPKPFSLSDLTALVGKQLEFGEES